MIPLIPKEIQGKIKFKHKDVLLKKEIVLNEAELEIFNKFREHIRNAERMEDDDDESV